MTMTREEFERFAVDDRRNVQSRAGVFIRKGRILLRPPYDVVPCECGDLNCHGWRVVELRPETLRHLDDREVLHA